MVVGHDVWYGIIQVTKIFTLGYTMLPGNLNGLWIGRKGRKLLRNRDNNIMLWTAY